MNDYIKFLVVIIVFGNPIFSVAQIATYAVPDSIATSVSKTKFKEVNKLTLELIRNLSTDEDKYRAIVKWISLNVEYKLGSNCKSGADVLKKKKAVCAGYSLLLKEMCDYAGIPCDIIVGDAKVGTSDIGSRLNFEDHAWNKIFINGEWHYSDVTWVTSSYDSETRKYNYEFNEKYFLAEPEFFNQKHFPENKEDIIGPVIKKRDYRKRAIPYSRFDLKKGTFVEFPKGKVSSKYKLKVPINSVEILLLYKEGKDYYVLKPSKTVVNENQYQELIFNTKEVRKGAVVFIQAEGEVVLFGVRD